MRNEIRGHRVISDQISGIGKAVFCAAAVMATPAAADWQYTKWGMTPEQVVAASGGKAELTLPKHLSSKNPFRVMECGVAYKDGRFDVTALFEFENRRLSLVNVLYEGADLADLKQMLEKKYGPGQAREDGTVWWFDRAAGDLIRLNFFRGEAIVTYWPLRGNEADIEGGGL